MDFQLKNGPKQTKHEEQSVLIITQPCSFDINDMKKWKIVSEFVLSFAVKLKHDTWDDGPRTIETQDNSKNVEKPQTDHQMVQCIVARIMIWIEMLVGWWVMNA